MTGKISQINILYNSVGQNSKNLNEGGWHLSESPIETGNARITVETVFVRKVSNFNLHSKEQR